MVSKSISAEQIGSSVIFPIEIEGLSNGDKVKIDMNYTSTAASSEFTQDNSYSTSF